MPELPRATSSLIFSIVVFPVPFLAWWAYARAPRELRSMWLLGAWAATSWFAGSLVWYAFFLANGSVVPTPPGWWDVFFAGAQLLLIAAVASADALVRSHADRGAGRMRDHLRRHRARSRVRRSRTREPRDARATVTTLNRPILGIVTLMLIAAAALGSWDGIPRSLALLGLGEIGLIVGRPRLQLRRSAGPLRQRPLGEPRLDGRRGALDAGGGTIILGIDRPLQLPARHRVPGHPVGSRAALLVTLVAIMLTLGVAMYALMGDRRNVALIAVAQASQSQWRWRREHGTRCGRLSTRPRCSTTFSSNLSAPETSSTSPTPGCATRTLSFATLQLAVAQGFNLIDERTQGRLRELVQQAGDDLAALVDETID